MGSNLKIYAYVKNEQCEECGTQIRSTIFPNISKPADIVEFCVRVTAHHDYSFPALGMEIKA